MSKKGLRGRGKWQDQSGRKAAAAELNFFEVFQKEFVDTPFRIRPQPKEFKNIYVDIELDEQVKAAIYNPKGGIKTHGIRPDYAFDNLKTKKDYLYRGEKTGWLG